jgi:hypothetical protein
MFRVVEIYVPTTIDDKQKQLQSLQREVQLSRSKGTGEMLIFQASCKGKQV